MIAAFVILALAASAQVQAFPGSEPVAELVATAPENLHSLLGSFDVICLLPYISEAKELVKEAPSVVDAVKSAVNDLSTRVSSCHGSSDVFICGCQAVRDAWEGTAADRDELIAFGQSLIDLALEVQKKCFSSKAQLRAHPRPQTLPRPIEH